MYIFMLKIEDFSLAVGTEGLKKKKEHMQMVLENTNRLLHD